MPISVGERIASTLVAGQRVYHHERCIYASDERPVDDREQVAEALAGAIPDGTCHGLTKAGKPCAGGAKRGELYCGPHLDKIARDSSPTHTTTETTSVQRSATHGPSNDEPS